jgi:hypothetical protein
MTKTSKTPGTQFFVRQRFPDLSWQIVSLPEAQAAAMRERGEKNIFETSTQAHAVCRKYERRRKENQS